MQAKLMEGINLKPIVAKLSNIMFLSDFPSSLTLGSTGLALWRLCPHPGRFHGETCQVPRQHVFKVMKQSWVCEVVDNVK